MALSGVVDSLLGRAVRDQDFRAKFLSAPILAAEESGYALNGEDREMLAGLDGEKASRFFQRLESDGTPMAWCSDHACYEVESSEKQDQ